MKHLLGRPLMTGWAILPLVLVVAATLYGPLAQKHGWTTLPFFGREYPVRLDLADVARLTRERDVRRTALALNDAAQEPGPPLALMMPVTPVPALGAGPDAGIAGADGTLVSNVSGIAGLQANSAAPGRGFIQVDFDLAGNGEQPGMLELNKTVQFEDAAIGQIAIRIDDASRIFISNEDLMRVIPASLRPSRAPSGDFVPLQQLRDQGVDLRYDPLNDQFVLRE